MTKEYKDEQLEDFESKRKEELRKELEKIKQKSLVTKANATKNAVEASLRDKAVAKQESFQEKGKKAAGVSAGYVAKETATGETFILKQFFKNHSDCKTEQDEKNRNDGVQEFIGATMYQFLLYDRAPKEQLVTPDQNNPKSLYVRSKFFQNVKQLSVFSGGSAGGILNPHSSKLKKIEGFEKVVAACHILGEFDYHAGNMMVTKDGKVTKIDHGRSFWAFHKDFTSMIDTTNKSFRDLGYDKAIAKGNLTFDVAKYSQSLNQMVSGFSEEQIDRIVDQRVGELEKAKFNPEGLVAMPRFSDKDDRNIGIYDFDDLRKVYKEITKENLRNMRDIAKQVEIVAKFSDVSPEFKKGGWLKAFAESKEKDPIKYAIMHKIKIDGMDPKQYVVSTIIDEYLQEKDPVKQAALEVKYKGASQQLGKDPILDKNNKTAKQAVLEKIVDQYLNTNSLELQNRLKEKYAAAQKLGEDQTPKLLTMQSNLGQFLSDLKAQEILANHKDLKGKSVLVTDIDYTKCDLPLIAKLKEVHEKSTKSRDYDKLSTTQKVGVAFATVVPIIGNVVAYYAMKSHNKSEKAKLEATIGQSLKGITSDLDNLSKKPKQHAGPKLGQHKGGVGQQVGKIRTSVSSHIEKRASTSLPSKKRGSGTHLIP